MVDLGGLEQQHGVARRRGVQDYQLPARADDDARERLEYRELVVTRGAELLFENGPGRSIESSAPRCKGLVPVIARLHGWVDTAHTQPRDIGLQRLNEMLRRICCREMRPGASRGQLHG